MTAANLPIRYSASGPVITNGDGGECVPGEGLALRVSEFEDSQGAVAFSGTSNFEDVQVVNTPNFLQVTLNNPKPNLRYAAAAAVMISTGTAGVKTVVKRFTWSVDGGSTFLPAPLTQSYEAGGSGTGNQQFTVIEPARLGSDLAAPVTNTTTSLICRLSFAGATDSSLSAAPNAAWIRLTESL